MQVWNVLHVARWNYRTQKWRKKSPSGHHATICRAMSSQLRHVSTIGKKLVKQQYLLHMSAQYGKLWPTSGWDRFGILGHPSYFQRVSRLGSVTAWQSSSEHQTSATYVRQGDHHVGHWPTFLVWTYLLACNSSRCTCLVCVQMIVDPNKYFENVLSSLRAATRQNLNRLRQPVDKNKSEFVPVLLFTLHN